VTVTSDGNAYPEPRYDDQLKPLFNIHSYESVQIQDKRNGFVLVTRGAQSGWVSEWHFSAAAKETRPSGGLYVVSETTHLFYNPVTASELESEAAGTSVWQKAECFVAASVFRTPHLADPAESEQSEAAGSCRLFG
jgi:hypothetical protein